MFESIIDLLGGNIYFGVLKDYRFWLPLKFLGKPQKKVIFLVEEGGGVKGLSTKEKGIFFKHFFCGRGKKSS